MALQLLYEYSLEVDYTSNYLNAFHAGAIIRRSVLVQGLDCCLNIERVLPEINRVSLSPVLVPGLSDNKSQPDCKRTRTY